MPYILSFFLFTILVGLLMHGAMKNGEIRHRCTKQELEQLATRGRTIHFISWPFVGFALLKMLDWASGGIPDRNFTVIFIFFMLAAGIPAGLVSWGLNTALEHTKFRIVAPPRRKSL